MDPEQTRLLSAQFLAMADDELLLGQRDSEWCGRAPIIEEDIAFANLALDEFGHALVWYNLLAGLEGDQSARDADQLVYFRDPEDFRCMQLVELPNGDWAFSMLRQYLFDSAEQVRLEALQSSAYAPLAQAAAKIRPEERYHYRHTHAWVLRLGLGTEESHHRVQTALDTIWPYVSQFFGPLPGEAALVAAGILPPSDGLRAAWEGLVLPVLGECGLNLPASPQYRIERREHTPYLKALLAEMQSVARLDPQAEW
jgi:ring-1,2-phenylacetyl-CoA epoxidase subunit PaaC